MGGQWQRIWIVLHDRQCSTTKTLPIRWGAFLKLAVAKPVKPSFPLSWHSFGRAPGPCPQPNTSPPQQVSRPHFYTHFLSLPWTPHVPRTLSPAAANPNIPRRSSMCRVLRATRSATPSNWPPQHPILQSNNSATCCSRERQTFV